jgi:hypothetical protein
LTPGQAASRAPYLLETEGVTLTGADLTPEMVAAQFDAISNSPMQALPNAFAQTHKFVGAALKARGG